MYSGFRSPSAWFSGRSDVARVDGTEHSGGAMFISAQQHAISTPSSFFSSSPSSEFSGFSSFFWEMTTVRAYLQPITHKCDEVVWYSHDEWLGMKLFDLYWFASDNNSCRNLGLSLTRANTVMCGATGADFNTYTTEPVCVCFSPNIITSPVLGFDWCDFTVPHAIGLWASCT